MVCEDRSSEQEQRANALALGAEEGRRKLRKATGMHIQQSIRGYPNGETRLSEPQSSYDESIVIRGETPRTETSK